MIGFLAAGVALGPFGLGRFAQAQPWLAFVTIADAKEIAEVAALGVVFLMFMIGLELSFERLMRLRRILFGLGTTQVLLSAIIIGGVAYAMGLSTGAAIVIGGSLALSSTAVVIPVLAEGKRLNSAVGRATFAVLLFQDLCVAPLLILVGVLGHAAGGGAGSQLVTTLAVAVPAIALIIVAWTAGCFALSSRWSRWQARPSSSWRPACSWSMRHCPHHRGKRAVDGNRRLHRRSPARRDGISARD